MLNYHYLKLDKENGFFPAQKRVLGSI